MNKDDSIYTIIGVIYGFQQDYFLVLCYPCNIFDDECEISDTLL